MLAPLRSGRGRPESCSCPDMGTRWWVRTGCARPSLTPPPCSSRWCNQTLAPHERAAPVSTRSSTPSPRPPTSWHAPTCSRSTTSPSSSCAPCGASTEAGGTAIRPRSKPAPERALALELAALAGGAGALADRALALIGRPGARRRRPAAGRAPGRAGLAGRSGRPGHRRSPPDSVHRRAEAATSTMAKGCSPGRHEPTGSSAWAATPVDPRRPGFRLVNRESAQALSVAVNFKLCGPCPLVSSP